jgi:3',5'-cyclic AMP phosphodiesterase CpdA
MRRRLFVKKFGQGISSSFLIPGIMNGKSEERQEPAYQYPVPENIEEAKNDEGHVVLRLELTGTSNQLNARLKGQILARKSNIKRIKSYFNLGDNLIDTSKATFNLSAVEGDRHIIALWLDEVTATSEVICKVNGNRISIKLNDILLNQQFEGTSEAFILNANFLLYNEVGVINTGEFRVPATSEQFRFLIMADPQGGDPSYDRNGSNTRIKIHNAFIEESIITANELDPLPVFTLILGDFTDHQGEEENFKQMIRIYEDLKCPILLEIGNHETRYRSEFTPGYNMTEFNNYFAAQKKINGLQKLLYSFDLGQWHFIVWPDPLRNNFWETHPHYFDWLERDLEENRDRPTFFFQHVPIHPIGINPLVSYVNPVHINRLLYNILSEYGNVKYIFSGHVHIPVKSSLKTAVTYKGINLINLPPTGYRPRSFGEEDFYGGPCQGMCIIDVDRDTARVYFKTVTHEVFSYPDFFAEYSGDKDPLWFNHKWEIKPVERLVNGNFEEGLKGWMQKFVYREDADPSNICEVRMAPDTQRSALYMYVRRRNYDKPGQDRLPQTLNQLTQVVRVPEQRLPVIQFKYQVDNQHFNPESWNGGFLWIEGFHRNHLMLNHVYSIGKAHRSIGGSYHYSAFTGYSFFDIYDGSVGWNEVKLNLKGDYGTLSRERSFQDLQLEIIVLNLGVWTINKGYQQEAAVFFTDLNIDFIDLDSLESSVLNNRKIGFLDKERIWNRPTRNVAGEHHYVQQEEVYPF